MKTATKRVRRKTLAVAFVLGLFSLAGSAAFAEMQKIPASPGDGFQWPYYLVVPDTYHSYPVLFVEPNNTGRGDDDPAVHDDAARSLAESYELLAAELGGPILVPTFPRPYTNWQVYTHALDRDTLLTDLPGLERVDLQLIAMIDHARARFAGEGVELPEKVWMNGFSASGMFVNRFTLIHPDRVLAAAIGAPGGWPTAPVASWSGEDLRFPVGIADLADLTGTPFDLEAFRQVPQYIWVGDQDTNDAVDFIDGFDPVDQQLIYDLFGDVEYVAERWPVAEEVFDSAGAAAQFRVYPGVGHEYTDSIIEDLRAFAEANRPVPEPGALCLAATAVFSLVLFGLRRGKPGRPKR